MQVRAEAALFPFDGFQKDRLGLATLGDAVDDAYEQWAIWRSPLADRSFGGERGAVPSTADGRALHDDYRAMALRTWPPAAVSRRQGRWHERLDVASRQLERGVPEEPFARRIEHQYGARSIEHQDSVNGRVDHDAQLLGHGPKIRFRLARVRHVTQRDRGADHAAQSINDT